MCPTFIANSSTIRTPKSTIQTSVLTMSVSFSKFFECKAEPQRTWVSLTKFKTTCSLEDSLHFAFSLSCKTVVMRERGRGGTRPESRQLASGGTTTQAGTGSHYKFNGIEMNYYYPDWMWQELREAKASIFFLLAAASWETMCLGMCKALRSSHLWVFPLPSLTSIICCPRSLDKERTGLSRFTWRPLLVQQTLPQTTQQNNKMNNNKKHGANCVVCLGFIDFRVETFVKTHEQYYHVKCFQSPLCANPLCGKKITKGLVVKVLST